MSIALGNLLGAAANITTAISHGQSLNQFLQGIDFLGVQVKNNFEVNFSGLEHVTFFIQSIDIPGVHQNFTELYYDGRKVDVPVNFEYDHEFSMTVLNDAQGLIYATLVNFIANDASNALAKSGYTMTVKALTGDDTHYAGSMITLNGVRIESVSGLSFGYDQNEIQTFTISGKMIDFTYTPGAIALAANIDGALNKLLG